MKPSRTPTASALALILAGASGTAFAHPGHAHGTDGFFNALIHAFTEPGVLLPLIAVGAYLGWRARRAWPAPAAATAANRLRRRAG